MVKKEQKRQERGVNYHGETVVNLSSEQAHRVCCSETMVGVRARARAQAITTDNESRVELTIAAKSIEGFFFSLFSFLVEQNIWDWVDIHFD